MIAKSWCANSFVLGISFFYIRLYHAMCLKMEQVA
jgi:hypothetical protein